MLVALCAIAQACTAATLLHDLSLPLPELQSWLRESAEGVVLSGAAVQPIESLEQAMSIIEEANKNRVTSATSMNDASSRSHSVLVLDVARFKYPPCALPPNPARPATNSSCTSHSQARHGHTYRACTFRAHVVHTRLW